jgi:DNA transformation protein
MTPSDSFLAYIQDQFSSCGEVSIRKMFGGAGLFYEGKMFGLIADDQLYFKVNSHNKADFIAKGMGPFVYEGKKKPVTMSYYQLPEEVLEDVDTLREWMDKARLGGN